MIHIVIVCLKGKVGKGLKNFVNLKSLRSQKIRLDDFYSLIVKIFTIKMEKIILVHLKNLQSFRFLFSLWKKVEVEVSFFIPVRRVNSFYLYLTDSENYQSLENSKITFLLNGKIEGFSYLWKAPHLFTLGFSKENLKVGLWIVSYKISANTIEKCAVEEYKNGKLNGFKIRFYSSGAVYDITRFRKDIEIGYDFIYDIRGTLINVIPHNDQGRINGFSFKRDFEDNSIEMGLMFGRRINYWQFIKSDGMSNWHKYQSKLERD